VKLIKLDGRHTLYHRGYRYAFLFEHGRFTAEANSIERAVKQLEGYHWDNTFWGKARISPRLGYSVRPYYVGLKNEATASMVLLKM
jgi:hypothetical protein